MLASVIEDTTEVLDRYALLERIELSASLYPLTSRNQAVVAAIPGEKTNQAVLDFMQDQSSPRIERWLELERAASDSWAALTPLDGFASCVTHSRTPIK